MGKYFFIVHNKGKYIKMSPFVFNNDRLIVRNYSFSTIKITKNTAGFRKDFVLLADISGNFSSDISEQINDSDYFSNSFSVFSNSSVKVSNNFYKISNDSVKVSNYKSANKNCSFTK